MKRSLLLLLVVVIGGVSGAETSGPPPGARKSAGGKVQFARDVLPLLSANCFACHGPDEKTRKAGLRLDLAEAATRTLKGGSRAVVPGDPDQSELVARIFATDSERMPPAKS